MTCQEREILPHQEQHWENLVHFFMGICMKFSDLWYGKKNREKYMSKKNKHTQDSIYVIRQFAYVHRVAGVSLFSRKNTECGSTFFLSKKRHQNPNLQNNSFYILCIGFTMGYKNGPNFFSRGRCPRTPKLGPIGPSLRSID